MLRREHLEDKVPRRMQGAMSYKCRKKLDLNNEVKANQWKSHLCLRTRNHKRIFATGSEAQVTSEPRKSSRYSVGLTLQASRKTWAKCCGVLKPQARATSNTRASQPRNIALARSTLRRRTN